MCIRHRPGSRLGGLRGLPAFRIPAQEPRLPGLLRPALGADGVAAVQQPLSPSGIASEPAGGGGGRSNPCLLPPLQPTAWLLSAATTSPVGRPCPKIRPKKLKSFDTGGAGPPARPPQARPPTTCQPPSHPPPARTQPRNRPLPPQHFCTPTSSTRKASVPLGPERAASAAVRRAGGWPRARSAALHVPLRTAGAMRLYDDNCTRGFSSVVERVLSGNGGKICMRSWDRSPQAPL